MIHSAFVDNPGGALLIENDADLDSSVFVNSDAVSIIADSGLINIQDCSFLDNNGAIAVSAPCSTTVKQSIFDHNVKPDGAGGAILGIGDFTGASGSFLSLTDCEFVNNSADSGGAIWCEDMNLQVKGSSLHGNSTGTGGAMGAVATSGQVCRVAIDSTDFTGNNGNDGAAIHLQGVAGTGPVQFNLAHATVSENSGTNGAVYGASVTEIPGYDALMERSCFFDNAAAIALVEPFNSSMIKLNSLTIAGNAGAALYSDQPVGGGTVYVTLEASQH